MNDHEIHECIDKKNEALLGHVEKLIDKYTSTITEFLSEENGQTRHSIHELTKRMDQQNGSVKKLTEWQAKHEGEHSGKNMNIARILQVGAFVATCIMAYIGYANLKKNSIETMRRVDDITPIINRGGYYNPFANDTIK